MLFRSELQKVLDQKIGMGMVGGNMNQFMQYQAAQALPAMAAASGQGGVAGDAAGLGAGLASIMIYLLMAAVLFWRPQGLFPARG